MYYFVLAFYGESLVIIDKVVQSNVIFLTNTFESDRNLFTCYSDWKKLAWVILDPRPLCATN